jgi:glucose-1-phosphate adenylyltransferase
MVFASDNEYKMSDLTIHRTVASLPFGGRYRFIDFALSNMVNSNITTIGIITTSNYSSLMDHLRMGRDWDLNRKNSGLAVFPPYASNTVKNPKGKIDALYGLKDYMENAAEEYVVITNGNIASNIDFEDVFDFHMKESADITVLTYKAPPTSSKRFVISKKEGVRIKGMLFTSVASDEEKELSLNTYLVKKSLLLELLTAAYSENNVDFEKDILQKLTDTLRIAAYAVKGYSAIIDDIKSYFNESMKLLDLNVRNDLFYGFGKILTKVKDSVPTIYKSNADVKNSLIADGCTINGTVENSILFRNVTVEEGAVVKNSIIMENGKIMRGTKLSYIITDKNVTVREDRNISGYATYPIVIVKDKEV